MTIQSGLLRILTHGSVIPLAVTSALMLAPFSASRLLAVEEVCHCNSPKLIAEHQALMDLIPIPQATVKAVRSGNWSDAGMWNAGVPGANAKVYIPNGMTVTYDVNSSSALTWLRVEGALTFATNTDTRLVIDTLGIMSVGSLTIGTVTNQLSEKTCKIQFRDNGPIARANDPTKVGRGLIAIGAVRMHGRALRTFTSLSVAPLIGATTLTLTQIPTGWRVGDTVIVGGTHFPYPDHQPAGGTPWSTQDERRTVTAISGSTVTLNAALLFKHDSPDISKHKPYVANLTRTITFSSLANGTVPIPIQQRGHVMMMHNQDVEISYVGMVDLGRTDKSKHLDDPGTDLESTYTNGVSDDTQEGNNPRGRYSLHLHRSGTATYMGTPAVIRGCAVDGNPGWGYAVHEGFAFLEDNVSYACVGTGFMSEMGNETGVMRHNIAINGKGNRDPESSSRGIKSYGNDDFASIGTGFWFQSRLMSCEDNVAISHNFAGFVWFHRQVADPFLVNVANARFPRILTERNEMDTGTDNLDGSTFQGIPFNDLPIRDVRRNVSIGCEKDLEVMKRGNTQRHDIRTIFADNTGWYICNGMEISYTGFYSFLNHTLVGDPNWWGVKENSNRGPSFNTNSVNFAMLNPQFSGIRLDRQLDVPDQRNDSGISDPIHRVDVVGGNLTMTNGHLKITEGINSNNTAIDSYIAGTHNWYASYDPTKPVTFVPDPSTLTAPNVFSHVLRGMNLNLWGTKTDSIASQPYFSNRAESEWSGAAVDRDMRTRGIYRGISNPSKLYLPQQFHYFDRITNKMGAVTFAYDVTNFEATAARTDTINGTLPTNLTTLFTNRAPTGGGESYLASSGVRLDVTQANGVLKNDTDPDGDPIRVEISQIVQPTHGWVSLRPNGSFSYQSEAGYIGNDSFTYVVNDGMYESAPITVAIGVGTGGVNLAPTVSLNSPASGSSVTAGATVGLQATASDTDGSVAKVEFLVDGAKIGEDASAPYALSWQALLGNHSLTARATDNLGAVTVSAPVAIIVTAVVPPSGLTSRTIGAATAGTYSETGGTITIQGSGADIWNAADSFQFVSQPLTGDGTIIVRIASMQNTNSWAKAGIMVRETTATGSKHAFCCVTPANGVAFQRRTTTGGSSSHTAGSRSSAPRWLKLTRQGAVLTGYESADGVTWNTVGSLSLSLTNPVQIGLAVTSHANGTLCTAVFDHLTISPAGNG